MRIVGACVLAALLAGCASTETVRFQPRAQQEALVRDGIAALVSRGRNSVVTMRPGSREIAMGQRLIFSIGIENTSRSQLEFRVAGISASQLMPSGTNTAMKVYTYEELVSEARTDLAINAVLVGLSAAGSTYGASRRGYYAQTAVAQQNADAAAALAARGKLDLAALEALVIKDNTTLPGERYGGLLYIQQPSSSEGSKNYVVTIIVGPDRHEFEIIQGKQN